ncbi:hypothetical protein EVAR_56160_1 [Eumeta japonica]|uniref:Uncharacterized protein n=1 Tax=Eumeta variegata TaxID=151549 RepID=A0A4C1Y563_EUMVA|nr:hypothetical protein EVAR_56160_1 [Eumeta japonica]
MQRSYYDHRPRNPQVGVYIAYVDNSGLVLSNNRSAAADVRAGRTHCEYRPSTRSRSRSSSSRQSRFSTTTGGGLCSARGSDGDPGPPIYLQWDTSLGFRAK